MNEQALNKGLMIAGGLLGLGLLGYLFFREKEETTVDAEFTIVEDSKSNKAEKPVIIKKEVSVVKIKPKIPFHNERHSF
jgi:hypothetical protein